MSRFVSLAIFHENTLEIYTLANNNMKLSRSFSTVSTVSLLFFSSLNVRLNASSIPPGKLQILPHATQFIVLGDWGRNGGYHQKDVAKMMNTDAGKLDDSFIISTGDNFYENGVASIDDPQFMSSYENIYSGANLFVNWYITLGNHDYMGNVQAEVDYTNKSRRWNMPARYYTFTKHLEDGSGTIQFFVIDTSPLIRKYHHEEKYRNVIGQDTTAQMKWLEHQLSISKARWKIVVGHHPVYSSIGTDVPSYFRDRFTRLFTKYHVDVYFCGHEHNMEYLNPGGYTKYFISGAGSQVEATGNASYTKYAKSVAGFMAVSVKNHEMLVQMVNYKGAVLKTVTLNK